MKTIKILSIGLIIVSLLAAVCFGDYFSDMIKLMEQQSADAYEISDKIGEWSNKEIGTYVLLQSINKLETRAINRFWVALNLDPPSEFDQIHEDVLAVFAYWYLGMSLVERGLENNDQNQINMATTIIQHANTLTRDITQRVKNK